MQWMVVTRNVVSGFGSPSATKRQEYSTEGKESAGMSGNGLQFGEQSHDEGPQDLVKNLIENAIVLVAGVLLLLGGLLAIAVLFAGAIVLLIAKRIRSALGS
jgi:hypothetical protein